MTRTRKRLYQLAALTACATMASGCDANNKIPLTMEGWGDIRIGASASLLDPHITEDTISTAFGHCVSHLILKDVPRATFVAVDVSTDRIISIRIAGVSKVKTQHGIGLNDSLDDIRDILGPDHQFIVNADYVGSPVTKANIGDRVIAWADPETPGTTSEPTPGIRFTNYRSNDSLSSIAVGEFKDNGDTVCD